MFITMLFGYYWLAKIEERECEEKYGEFYREYKKKTSMFIPFTLSLGERFGLPVSGWKRKCAQAILYTMAIAFGVAGASMVEIHSLNSLYTYSTSDSVTVSVVKMNPETLRTIVETALSNEGVRKRLLQHGPGARYLNYVLPSEWYISEIPMESKKGFYHLQPKNYDRNLCKIIFTRADLRRGDYENAKGFLRQVSRRVPAAEAWIDISRKQVTEIKNPPLDVKYENIPVAIY
jgi:hypothetical protein